jgi:ABC-type polysaccharide/polyol phosphate export permease
VPLILANLALLTSGPAYLMTVLGVYQPDYRGAVQNLIRMGFFVSAGLVRPEMANSQALELVLRANPLSGIFESLRAAVIYGRAPRAADFLYPFAVGLLLLAVSLMLYKRAAPGFAKEV